MSGYYNVPGIPEAVFLTYTDWIGYVKDDGSYGYLLQNGVPVGADWAGISGKPATFPPTLGTTSDTAKAGNYTPDWADVTSKPSTVAGYGITDALGLIELEAALADKVTVDQMNTELSFKVSETDLDMALSNKLNIPNPPSYTPRPLNTIFQLSTTRPAAVSYSVQIVVTASIAGGQAGDVILEVSPSATFSFGAQTIAIAGLGQTYTLAIAIQGVQPQTSCVAGVVPIGWYARLRTVNTTGSPAFSVRASQEVIL